MELKTKQTLPCVTPQSQGHALNTQYCQKVVHILFKYLNTVLVHTCKIFSRSSITSFYVQYVPLVRKTWKP